MNPIFTTQDFLGPVGALVISLIFATAFWKLSEKNRESWERSVDRQIQAMEKLADAHKATSEAHKEELKHCHSTQQRLQDQLYSLALDYASVKKQVESIISKNNG